MHGQFLSVQKHLKRKTHSTGTLRSNRRGPKLLLANSEKEGIDGKEIEIYMYQKGERKRRGRDDLYYNKVSPQLISIKNRFGNEKTNPIEVTTYKDYMSGVDRWYKKVLFHLLNVVIWNSFYIMKNFNNKLTFLQFRENLSRDLLNISEELSDGRKLVHSGAMHGENVLEWKKPHQ